MFALIQLRPAIGRRFVSLFMAAWLPLVAAPCFGASIADPPAPPQADEILLISTRKLGTTCDPNRMDRELDCWRLTFDAAGQPTWVAYDWHNLQFPANAQRQTVMYVHGNRVSEGVDAAEFRDLVEGAGQAFRIILLRAREKIGHGLPRHLRLAVKYRKVQALQIVGDGLEEPPEKGKVHGLGEPRIDELLEVFGHP